MSDFRFILEPYTTRNSRYLCPACGKKRTFTRYVDLTTNEYLSSRVGKCDRIQKCGYHYPPKQFFEERELFKGITTVPVPLGPQVRPESSRSGLAVSFIDKTIFQETLGPTRPNHLLSFLEGFVSLEHLEKIRERYRLGASEDWKGSTIFWQIDEQQQIRTGKVMQYNKTTGRKEKVNWVHAMLKMPDYNLEQCLFGLHLLSVDRSSSIAIVESEKTAIIASIVFPQYIWMATGGFQNLKPSLLKPLENRHVVLFPDAGCYNSWKEKIDELPKNISFNISELVERTATEEEKNNGYDLADYIINIWKERANF